MSGDFGRRLAAAGGQRPLVIVDILVPIRFGMAQKFPTAALAVLDFDVPDWRSIKPGEGRLIDYVRPKDLETPAKANDA